MFFDYVVRNSIVLFIDSSNIVDSLSSNKNLNTRYKFISINKIIYTPAVIRAFVYSMGIISFCCLAYLTILQHILYEIYVFLNINMQPHNRFL